MKPAKGEERHVDNRGELLDTDGRVLAYLRAAMLESGDDPKAMAYAIDIVESARLKLQRKGAFRATCNVIEQSRLICKRLP